jgi:hypothetical protein
MLNTSGAMSCRQLSVRTHFQRVRGEVAPRSTTTLRSWRAHLQKAHVTSDRRCLRRCMDTNGTESTIMSQAITPVETGLNEDGVVGSLADAVRSMPPSEVADTLWAYVLRDSSSEPGSSSPPSTHTAADSLVQGPSTAFDPEVRWQCALACLG